MNKLLTFSRNFVSLFIFVVLITSAAHAQSPWTPLTNIAPDTSGGVMLLLSDGTVISKTYAGGLDGIGNIWDRLTPDINGSYANGTWSTIAPMNDTRLYFSTQVLKDGRVYVAGGEYGSGLSKGEVYNPLTNTWSLTPNPGLTISDANSEILPDGRILQACVSGNLKITRFYNPATNTYSLAPPSLGIHNESSWVKLANNSILMVDRNSTNSERYIPSLNQWVADATVPVPLYDVFGYETGPAFLLPDGRAFFLGSTNKTAYYTPSGNNSPGSWTAGPLIPAGNGIPDGAGAMMVNGKILCAVSPSPVAGNVFLTPTTYYEFDYITNAFTQVSAPAGGLSNNEPCYVSNMLDLPNGQVLYSQQGYKQYYVYTPTGAPLAVGKPTITSVIQTGCNSFSLTGMLFNGISEGAGYGDDWQMNSNYPIIRLTSGPNVYYARTFNWNRTGVQTGNLPDTTQFTLPVGLLNATYSLCVIANGISSDPVSFTFSPLPFLSSTLAPPDICSNTAFTYTPTSVANSPVFLWTRALVPGISNPAIVTPQLSNPNEVLLNTSGIMQTVIYNFTTSSNGCSNVQQVTLGVKPTPSITVAGPTSICAGNAALLSASGATSYLWSNGVINASITISPTTTTIYSVTGTSSCSATQQVTVTVNTLPVLSITATSTICIGDSISLSASGGLTYLWGNGNTNSSIGIAPNITTVYSVTTTDAFGCQKSDSITITVSQCVGINEISTLNRNKIYVYPNPADEFATIIFNTNNKGNYSLKLIDVFGRVIKEEHAEAISGENSHSIYFNEVASGIYLAFLKKGNAIYKTKIVVK